MRENSTTKDWGFDIADIVVADHESDGHPRVSDRDRLPVISALEEAILDKECKLALLRDVKRLCGGRFRHLDLGDDEWVQRVLEEGLGILDGEELALLLMNPVLLCRLRDELITSVEDYELWWSPMDRLGRRRMAENGITFSLPAMQDNDESVASDASVPVGMLGKSGASKESFSAAHRIEIAAQDCLWIVGDAGSVHEPAVIEIEPLDDGGARVGLGGFLEPGPDVFVTFIWKSPVGDIVAEVSPPSPFCLQVCFEHAGFILTRKNTLTVHYRSGLESSPNLEVQIDIGTE